MDDNRFHMDDGIVRMDDNGAHTAKKLAIWLLVQVQKVLA